MKSLVQIIALAVGFGALLSVMHGNTPAAAAQQKQIGATLPHSEGATWLNLETDEILIGKVVPVGNNQVRVVASSIAVLQLGNGNHEIWLSQEWQEVGPYSDPANDKTTLNYINTHTQEAWGPKVVDFVGTLNGGGGPNDWPSFSACDNAPQFKLCNDGNGKP